MEMKVTPNDFMYLALQQAIQKVGGYSKAGQICNRDRAAVFRWKKTPVEDDIVYKLSEESGVSIHDLRPDVFKASRKLYLEVLKDVP
jgi:hypothetical protein